MENPLMKTTTLRFRPGTIDAVVYRHVVTENEYRIPDQLDPDGLILDVGAHIGCFSTLCWSAGARRIEAFEADPANAALARENLASTTVSVIEKAVWRSDRTDEVLRHSGYPAMRPDGPDPVAINTGGGHVFASEGLPVAAVSLDALIGERQVALLKLDCEGSEFPILLTSRRLAQVRRIVGEYHIRYQVPPALALEGVEHFTPGVLVDHLARQHFRVEICPHPDPRFSAEVGTFFADNLSDAGVTPLPR
jgi:FkbM family methyltransferase